MARILTDNGRRVGAYIVGEGAGADGGPGYSRENVTFAEGAEYVPGMVLGRLANGTYVPLAAAAADPATGSHLPVAVCYGFYDATDDDVKGVASVRRTTVSGHELVWPAGYDAAKIATATAALAALGIVVRN